jgi:hypothetical protein
MKDNLLKLRAEARGQEKSDFESLETEGVATEKAEHKRGTLHSISVRWANFRRWIFGEDGPDSGQFLNPEH